jgi:hypothetical protein
MYVSAPAGHCLTSRKLTLATGFVGGFAISLLGAILFLLGQGGALASEYLVKHDAQHGRSTQWCAMS